MWNCFSRSNEIRYFCYCLCLITFYAVHPPCLFISSNVFQLPFIFVVRMHVVVVMAAQFCFCCCSRCTFVFIFVGGAGGGGVVVAVAAVIGCVPYSYQFFSDARVPPDSSRQVFVFLSYVSCASASRYRFQCSCTKQKHTTVNTLDIHI